MTEPDTPDNTPPSPARRAAGFIGLVALYLVPSILGILVLLLVAGRQSGANAFRYVGF
jgi:hypothetical protein